MILTIILNNTQTTSVGYAVVNISVPADTPVESANKIIKEIRSLIKFQIRNICDDVMDKCNWEELIETACNLSGNEEFEIVEDTLYKTIDVKQLEEELNEEIDEELMS